MLSKNNFNAFSYAIEKCTGSFFLLRSTLLWQLYSCEIQICFVVNSTTEDHQNFRITGINFTPFSLFSFICKKTTNVKFHLHEGSQAPTYLPPPGYVLLSVMDAAYILNMNRQISTAYRFFISQILHFSFSHLTVLCLFSYSSTPQKKKKKERTPLEEKHSRPHLADFTFCWWCPPSKNLMLCPTLHQAHVSVFIHRAFCQQIQCLDLWSETAVPAQELK